MVCGPASSLTEPRMIQSCAQIETRSNGAAGGRVGGTVCSVNFLVSHVAGESM